MLLNLGNFFLPYPQMQILILRVWLLMIVSWTRIFAGL